MFCERGAIKLIQTNIKELVASGIDDLVSKPPTELATSASENHVALPPTGLSCRLPPTPPLPNNVDPAENSDQRKVHVSCRREGEFSGSCDQSCYHCLFQFGSVMHKTTKGMTYVLDEAMVDYIQPRTVFVISSEENEDGLIDLTLAEQDI